MGDVLETAYRSLPIIWFFEGIKKGNKWDMKTIKLITVVLIILSIAGCASNREVKPMVKTSEKFRVDKITLSVSQKTIPDIKYHSESEIQGLVKRQVMKLLEDKDLLTNQADANTLIINAKYMRNFVGDKTPFPTDSLAYPHYDYEIKVLDGAKELTTITRKNLTFHGGVAMNLMVMAGRLRKKTDENVFIDAFSKEIVASIEELKIQ